MTGKEMLSFIWDHNVFVLAGYHTAVFSFFMLFRYVQYFIFHDSFVINLGTILSFFLNRIFFSGIRVSSCFCYIEDILIYWRNILPSKRLEPVTLWHCLTSQNTWILSSSLPRSDPIQARQFYQICRSNVCSQFRCFSMIIACISDVQLPFSLFPIATVNVLMKWHIDYWNCAEGILTRPINIKCKT